MAQNNAIVEYMKEPVGTKIKFYKFLRVNYTQDYSVSVRCPYSVVPKTTFLELVLFPSSG